MHTPMYSELAERLGRLENDHRRLSLENNRLRRDLRLLARLGAAAIVGCAVLLTVGADADAPKVIEAERFVLKDRDGARRGSFEIKADGLPVLALSDKKGNDRVTLGLSPSGSARINLGDAGVKPGAALSFRAVSSLP